MKMINQDTICAIATAQGGAIGIIRVSGPKAIEITSRIFTPATGKPLTERAPYTLTFGKICSPKRKINNTLFQQTSEIPQEKSETLQKTSSITSSAEEVIDEVLISLFRAPHSYTGEDSTEIMCHGSSYILQQVIQLLIHPTCLPERENGLEPSRSCGRSDSLIVCLHPSPSHEPDARRIQ